RVAALADGAVGLVDLVLRAQRRAHAPVAPCARQAVAGGQAEQAAGAFGRIARAGLVAALGLGVFGRVVGQAGAHLP
ncbi:hypothetical protein DKX15_22780, partial [Enterococcus faecium]